MKRNRFLHSLMLAGGVCALLVGAAVTVQAQQYTAPQSYGSTQDYANSDQVPGRVARLAYLSGQVQFAPAGENDWGTVEVNRPMVIGDRLLTGDDGRAVLELGDASVRIAHGSAFDFLNLDQDNVQIELSQGTLNLAVRQLADGENFEVDTPTIAFVASQPGVYRIDNSPTGIGSMVSVFQGSGVVYGENGASRQVTAGTSYRFNDSTLASVDVTGLPQPDDFDRFCDTRDQNHQRYAQAEQQYVPPGMIGGDQLYQYGQWDNTPEYGNVWYPNTVPAGWAPYRYGHWAWVEPWGWTWVDDQPWGFAPFHYGRWVYTSNRWGWMPGPVNVRPVYAPALVAFIGGSGLSVSLRVGGGGPVGWFPLGPRDVYVPWFHASRRYFNRVNVTNIRNVYVNKTVINNFYGDYRAGRRPPHGRHDYAYRSLAGAVTAVPRNVFTGARPVHPAVLKLNRGQLKRTQVAFHPGVNPGKASLGLRRPTARPAILHGREPFAKPVVARHQPSPRPVKFSARAKAIASQHGRPLTATQMRNLRQAHPVPDSHAGHVKLVPAKLAGAAAHGPRRGTAPAHPVANPGPRDLSDHSTSPRKPPFKNTVHPIRVPVNPISKAPRRPGELPSARFRHPERPGTLPRAAVIQPASGAQRKNSAEHRLPVVKPIERTPQSLSSRAARQRKAEIKAPQHTRTPPTQPKRQEQVQAQQRARAQQSTQQRERAQQAQRQRQVQAQQRERAQQTTQQRERAQQAQRQRQVQVQAQQRARAQQATQQRERAQQAQRQRQVQAQQRARAQQATQQRERAQQAQRQRQVQAQAQQRERAQQAQRQRQVQVQAQQRARAQQAAQQRQQQVREREVRRAPQARQPSREPASKRHPSSSSKRH